ncbi:MAG: flagellar motor switch protein FliM [Planctomycetota bacterium]
MSDVLDQSEVDALLAAVDSGDVEEESSSAAIFSRHRTDFEGLEIRPYDFKRPERVSKDQMRSLQTLHEGFARNFGAALSGFLRTIVEVKVATCEQMTYGEFINALPNPTSFNLITADKLEGQMCLEISPLIIYPIIDRLLGGTSQDLFIPQRPMTQIEARLISNVTERSLIALAEAWEGVRKLEFKISATESNPQLAQIVPPNEVVVVVALEVKLSNRAGTMNLCIPYNVIEPVMDALSSESWFSVARNADDEVVQRKIKGTLDGALVDVGAILARTSIKLSELRSLAVGDLLVTEHMSSEPAVMCVGDEQKFLCDVGQHRSKRALKIRREIRPGDRI